MTKEEKNLEMDLIERKNFEKVLAENKTDFIVFQKGKGHYKVVGYHILNVDGDTTLVLELGKRIEG